MGSSRVLNFYKVLLVGAPFVFLVFATLFLMAGPSTSVQPKITWSQSHIEVTLSPGESTAKDITFTSGLTLQNIVIEPVPEIAPFLTIEPGAVQAVHAGQSQSVRLVFSVPQGATLGTYDGTVHVRIGTQTLPQTVKVVVNVWTRFAYPADLFTVRFPPGITSEFVSEANLFVLRLTPEAPEPERPGLFFSVDPNPEGLSVDQYYSGAPGLNLVGQSENQFSMVTVAGRPAYKFVPFVSLSGDIVVVIPLGGSFLRVTDHGTSFDAAGIFEPILSQISFKL